MAGGRVIDPSLEGAVSEKVFMVVIWVFWFLALVALVVRVAIYWRARRRPQVDDYLLMVSVACLTVATMWMQARYADAYTIIALSIDPFKAGLPSDLPGTIHRAQLVGFVYGPLIWTAIFAAKLSYLWFFRQLVQHIRPLRIYWWVVFVMTVAVYPICVTGVFVACPHMDLQAFKCNMQPLISRALNIAIASMALDMATDVMIVMIPVWLLWKVKIRLAQKAGLACFLCLSVVIAVMAVIRVSPLRLGEHPNLPYYSIWVDMMGQVEACVAVCLVSLSAFRYFFVMQDRKRHEEQEKRSWFRSGFDKIRQRRRSDDEDAIHSLPHIPSGTLTGLRSIIWKSSSNNTKMVQSTIVAERESMDEIPLWQETSTKNDTYSSVSSFTAVSRSSLEIHGVDGHDSTRSSYPIFLEQIPNNARKGFI